MIWDARFTLLLTIRRLRLRLIKKQPSIISNSNKQSNSKKIFINYKNLHLQTRSVISTSKNHNFFTTTANSISLFLKFIPANPSKNEYQKNKKGQKYCTWECRNRWVSTSISNNPDPASHWPGNQKPHQRRGKTPAGRAGTPRPSPKPRRRNRSQPPTPPPPAPTHRHQSHSPTKGKRQHRPPRRRKESSCFRGEGDRRVGRRERRRGECRGRGRPGCGWGRRGGVEGGGGRRRRRSLSGGRRRGRRERPWRRRRITGAGELL